MATDASTYKTHCRRYIADAREMPTIFFGTLRDLEWTLLGHGVAFLDVGLLQHPGQTFNERFGQWLHVRMDAAKEGGWATAVERLAEAWEVDAAPVFFELYDTFLEDGGWPD